MEDGIIILIRDLLQNWKILKNEVSMKLKLFILRQRESRAEFEFNREMEPTRLSPQDTTNEKLSYFQFSSARLIGDHTFHLLI